MSPNAEEVQAAMDEALKGFITEFRTLIDRLKPEQVHAIALLIDLMEKYRVSAGYKRTCHFMFNERPSLK